MAVDPGNDLDRLAPYLGEIAEACLLEGEDVALLAAICLRETEAGWAAPYNPKGTHLGRGDGGHGFGLFQVDDRGPYAYLVAECPEATPYLQCRWACTILADARHELAVELGGAFMRSPLAEVATVCCFNAGSPAVARMIRRGRHPDHATADGPDADHEGDYGSSVLAIRDRLRDAWAAPLPPASVPEPQIVPPGGVA